MDSEESARAWLFRKFLEPPVHCQGFAEPLTALKEVNSSQEVKLSEKVPEDFIKILSEYLTGACGLCSSWKNKEGFRIGNTVQVPGGSVSELFQQDNSLPAPLPRLALNTYCSLILSILFFSCPRNTKVQDLGL